jgi:translocator protein
MSAELQSAAQRSSPAPPTHLRAVLALGAWLVASFSAATMGALFPPGEWYAALAKPSWNPPCWIFGPVWSALYLMMAVAAWLVWKRGGFAGQRRPLALFITQLTLNAAWTPLFFGLHRPGLAFAEILLLWLAILATLVSFLRVNKLAGWLLAPYLAWVTFASVLNFTLWRLNP